jgi:hypothetical protein
MLGDHDLGAACIEIGDQGISAIRAFRRSGHFGDQGIAVESGIGDQRPEGELGVSGGTPTVSKRCPGKSTKRTRLPSASVSARILVVRPPLERPMAWL